VFHASSGTTDCVPFWPEPISTFGSLSVTMLTAVHLCWAFHPACPSNRIGACSFGIHLTVFSASLRCREVVSAASDQTVTSFASADGLLRTESQVRLTIFMSYRTIIGTPSFRRDAPPLVKTRFLRLAQISPPVARSPARWNVQRLPRHLAKCFAWSQPCCFQCSKLCCFGMLPRVITTLLLHPVLTALRSQC
jgi:hypothetical protein